MSATSHKPFLTIIQMGGVDKKDQLLSAYPIEQVRNQVWYKILFRRVLNVSILNSLVLFRCNESMMAQRVFRNYLAEALITPFRPPEPPRNEVQAWAVEQKRLRLVNNYFIVKGQTRSTVCVWCRNHGTKTCTTYKCEQCYLSVPGTLLLKITIRNEKNIRL